MLKILITVIVLTLVVDYSPDLSGRSFSYPVELYDFALTLPSIKMPFLYSVPPDKENHRSTSEYILDITELRSDRHLPFRRCIA